MLDAIAISNAIIYFATVHAATVFSTSSLHSEKALATAHEIYVANVYVYNTAKVVKISHSNLNILPRVVVLVQTPFLFLATVDDSVKDPGQS